MSIEKRGIGPPTSATNSQKRGPDERGGSESSESIHLAQYQTLHLGEVAIALRQLQQGLFLQLVAYGGRLLKSNSGVLWARSCKHSGQQRKSRVAYRVFKLNEDRSHGSQAARGLDMSTERYPRRRFLFQTSPHSSYSMTGMGRCLFR